MSSQDRQWCINGRWYEGARYIYPSSGEAFWVIRDLANRRVEIGTVSALDRRRFVNDDQPHIRHYTLKSAVESIVTALEPS